MVNKSLTLLGLAVALLGAVIFANSTLAQKKDNANANLGSLATGLGELQTRSPFARVYLPDKMTFHQGSDAFIVVPTGGYIVEKHDKNKLRLTPESGGLPLEIMAIAGKHEAEGIREPQALLVPVANSADCHLLLLLPGGEHFDAPGTTGSVTTRDLSAAPLSPALVAQEYAAYKLGVDGMLPTAPDTGDAAERGVIRRPSVAVTPQTSKLPAGSLPGNIGTSALNRPHYPPGTLLNAGGVLTADESMPIWRLQLHIITADLQDAKTDDHIAVSLAPGNLTYLDTPIDDFERGVQTTYDLAMSGISKLSDIKYIRFYKSGSNGWCLRYLVFHVNGKQIFDYNPGRSGWWLDPGENSNWQSVPAFELPSNQLRSHALWRAYKQPDYPYSISYRELTTRVYAAYGQLCSKRTWKWGSDGRVFLAGKELVSKLPRMFIGDPLDSPDEVRVVVSLEEVKDNWANNRWRLYMDMKWTIEQNGFVRVKLNDGVADNNGNWMSQAVFVARFVRDFVQQNYFSILVSMLTCSDNVCTVERPFDNSYMDMVLPIRADFISIYQLDLGRGYIQLRQAPAGTVLW